MNRPEDIAEWAWIDAGVWLDKSLPSGQGHSAEMGYQETIARALLKAREEAFEEMKAVADREFARPKGQDPWANGYRSAAAEILDAIRQHSQKGEK